MMNIVTTKHHCFISMVIFLSTIVWSHTTGQSLNLLVAKSKIIWSPLIPVIVTIFLLGGGVSTREGLRKAFRQEGGRGGGHGGGRDPWHGNWWLMNSGKSLMVLALWENIWWVCLTKCKHSLLLALWAILGMAPKVTWYTACEFCPSFTWNKCC